MSSGWIIGFPLGVICGILLKIVYDLNKVIKKENAN
jgi:hypothetical protein